MTRPTPRDVAAARRLLAEDRKAKREERGPKLAKTDTGKASRGRVLDPGYLAFLRRLPCIACAVEGGHCGPTESAHIRFSDAKVGRVAVGMQRKPDDVWATPLGRGHHQHDQHKRSERAFWERLGVNPNDLATALHAAYLAGEPGQPVITRFAALASQARAA